MDKLYIEWVSDAFHKDNLFIFDGAIDKDLWENADVKIAFLLKEAYHSSKSAGTWDLIDGYLSQNLAKSRTFRPLGQWAYGINKINETGQVQAFCNEQEKLNKALKACAVINLKKSNGHKKSNDNDMSAYVDNDWDKYTYKQLTKLNPDIVVCARTWHLIKNRMPDHKYISDRIFENKGIYYVDYYHPAYIVPSIMKYYALCSLISQSKILKKR